MAKVRNNGGRIGKTVDFASTDAYTTGSTNKKNSGIWNLDSAVPAPSVLPDYTAFSTYSIGNINEGATTNFSIPIPDAPPSGTSVLVSVSGYTDSGVNASQNGEPAVFNSSGELQFSFTFSADGTTESNQTLTFTLAATDSLGNPTGSATNTTGTLIDTSKTVAYEITSVSDSTPNEGSPIDVQFRVSNSNETLYWTTTAGSSDVNPVSGSSSWVSTTTVGNDTWYNHAVTIFINADSSSEGNEQFTFNLRSGSTSGTIQDSINYTIQDTSRGILYGVYATSDTTPDEGTTPYVDFYVTNSSSTMYWSIDSGTSDFSTGSGSVNYYTTQVGYPTANGNDTAYIYRVNLSVTADDTTEGSENHTIRFRSGSTSGTIRASQTLTVQDTSQDPPAAGGGSTLSGVLLTRSGQYSTTSWENNISIDLSPYVGSTGRLVFYYESNTSFRGDIQLDNINLNGTTYTFTSNNDGFETTTVDTNSVGSETTAHYDSLVFSSVPTGTTTYRWNRDAAGTPSSSTGLTVDASGSSSLPYLYAETSVTHPASFWLRSPEVTLTTGTCSISCARYGSNIGTLKVYWYGTSPSPALSFDDLTGTSMPDDTLGLEVIQPLVTTSPYTFHSWVREGEASATSFTPFNYVGDTNRRITLYGYAHVALKIKEVSFYTHSNSSNSPDWKIFYSSSFTGPWTDIGATSTSQITHTGNTWTNRAVGLGSDTTIPGGNYFRLVYYDGPYYTTEGARTQNVTYTDSSGNPEVTLFQGYEYNPHTSSINSYENTYLSPLNGGTYNDTARTLETNHSKAVAISVQKA